MVNILFFSLNLRGKHQNDKKQHTIPSTCLKRNNDHDTQKRRYCSGVITRIFSRCFLLITVFNMV